MPQKIFLKIKITLYKSRAGYVATWSQLSPKSDISRHYSLNEKEGSLKAPCFFGVDFFHALKSNLSESRSFKINLLELLHLIKVIPMFLCQGFTTVENHCNGYRSAFLCSAGFKFWMQWVITTKGRCNYGWPDDHPISLYHSNLPPNYERVF